MSQGGGITMYFCQPIPTCSSDVCIIDCKCGTLAECDHESKKLAIIVGCIFGLLLLIIVISGLLAVLRCRKRKQKLAAASGQQPASREQGNSVPDSRQAQPMDIAAHDKQDSTNIEEHQVEGLHQENSCSEEGKNCDKLELKYCQI